MLVLETKDLSHWTFCWKRVSREADEHIALQVNENVSQSKNGQSTTEENTNIKTLSSATLTIIIIKTLRTKRSAVCANVKHWQQCRSMLLGLMSMSMAGKFYWWLHKIDRFEVCAGKFDHVTALVGVVFFSPYLFVCLSSVGFS